MTPHARKAAPNPHDQVRTDLPVAAVLSIFCACGSQSADQGAKSRRKQVCKYCGVQVWPPTEDIGEAARDVMEAARRAFAASAMRRK